jgi:polysaccharide export outer membrane protein
VIRILNRVIRRPFILSAALLLIAGAAGIDDGLAQTATPTAEQLDIFRNLPADQQQGLLKQIGGALSGTGLSGSLGGSSRTNPNRDGQPADQLTDQTDTGRLRSDTESAGVSPIPLLKPQDTVIIEVDFRLAPRLPSSYAVQPTQVSPNATVLTPQGGTGSGATSNPQPQVLPQQSQSQGQPETELQPAEKQRLNDLITLIRSRNPYKLSRDGVLFLPGFAGIPLGGLIEDLATLRLKVDPALAGLDVRVTKLPLDKAGPEALKPFGYDLFRRSPSTFAPVTNIPVPADYVVGAGDQFEVQLYGTQNRTFTLFVGRDGRVNFPEIGPINVAGERFNDVKASIEARVASQMIGVRASVSMADTRAIRVFVLGEVNRPGTYTVSGLGTITSALFAAGGVQTVGSLRDIQLKRQGALVRRLDLYDLLIRGDTSDDTKLLPGDVIFIPPVGPTISVEGEVRRPAIYETRGETTVAQVVQLAGGLSPEADSSKAMLTRIDELRRRVVVQVDPAAPAASSQKVRNGDTLRISRLRPTLDSGVLLSGYAYTTGAVAYHDGMRLSDVIHSVDELQPNADIHYLLIRRELPPDRRIAVLSADLAAALKAPGSAADVKLMPRDQVTVFDLQSGRDRVIQPVLDELRLQATLGTPTEVVRVNGRVRVPGEYPLEPGMRISDLIRAGGSLQDAAYGSGAELIRYDVADGEARNTKFIDIDLAAVLRGDPKADLRLEPFDLLSIKELPQWGDQESVTLLGEVRFPGSYAIKRGETLKSVVQRAGGLTEAAFVEGSVFTREDLKRREQEQLDSLAQRLQRDLAILALESVAATQGQGGGQAITVGQSLLSQLRGTKAVGRLVIDLPQAMHAKTGSEFDILLRGGDRLLVPKTQQEVSVIGEVPNATAHLYRAGLTRDDYVSLSGGPTRRADKKRIYVVHANGSLVTGEGNRWFVRTDDVIKPGDTVVVPLDTERLPPLPFWQAVTSIIYNVAIAAAAVHSF